MFGTGIGLVWDTSVVETTTQKAPSKLSYWNALHSYPMDDFEPSHAEDFFRRWWNEKPTCQCEPLVLDDGPDVSSGERFFAWGIQLHNVVNRKLHQESNPFRYYPEVGHSEALAMWHPDRYFQSIYPGNKLVIMLAAGPFRALARYTAGPARQYANRCGADFLLITNQLHLDWKRDKFRIWDYAKHYHEVLFVDADLLIRPDCPSIFDLPPEVSIAMTDDMPFAHMPPLSGDWVQGDYNHCMKLQGIEPRHAEVMLNSGFVLTRGPGHDIWQPPLHPLGSSHCAEQWWIQYQAESSGLKIHLLDPRWNWQHWYPSFAKHRSTAWVEHFSGIPLERKLEEIKRLSVNVRSRA
jgi:hypothetical protein